MSKNQDAVALGKARQGHHVSKIHEHAEKLGVQGGKVGGAARAKALTPAERSSIAAKGGRAKANK